MSENFNFSNIRTCDTKYFITKNIDYKEICRDKNQAIQRMRNNLLRHPHLMTQLNQVMLDIITIQWSFPFANAQNLRDLKTCLEALLNIVHET